MRLSFRLFQHNLATILLIVLLWPSLVLAEEALDNAFDALADGQGWQIAEADILREWSRSGSPALDLLLKRGEAALDEGDLETAIGHFTALTDHAPDFVTGWYMRAETYAANGQAGPAIADLAQALSIEPRHFLALTRLGALYEELEQPERALEIYRASLALHPHQLEALDSVARLENTLKGTDI